MTRSRPSPTPRTRGMLFKIRFSDLTGDKPRQHLLQGALYNALVTHGKILPTRASNGDQAGDRRVAHGAIHTP